MPITGQPRFFNRRIRALRAKNVALKTRAIMAVLQSLREAGKRGRLKRSKARNLLERLRNFEHDVLRTRQKIFAPAMDRKYPVVFDPWRGRRSFVVFAVTCQRAVSKGCQPQRLWLYSFRVKTLRLWIPMRLYFNDHSGYELNNYRESRYSCQHHLG